MQILSSYSALFLMMLDSSIVAVLLSSISSEFLATNQAQWLGTSLSVPIVYCTPMQLTLLQSSRTVVCFADQWAAHSYVRPTTVLPLWHVCFWSGDIGLRPCT